MIFKTPTGNQAFSAVDPFLTAGSPIPPPYSQGGATWTGQPVSLRTARGLPAAGQAMRLLAETAAGLPLITYRDKGDGQRERVKDSLSWLLLYVKPNPIVTPFNFKAFIGMSLQSVGNAYVFKEKTVASRRKPAVLKALWTLDATRVKPIVKDSKLTFMVRMDAGGQPVEMDSTQILHIPGLLTDSQFVGVSPIVAHAQSMGVAIAAEEFAGRYFGNDATPSGLYIPSETTTPKQRQEFRESMEGRHRGVAAAHKLGILPFAGTYQQIGVNARDAQLIDVRNYNVAETARIFNVDVEMLNHTGGTRTYPPPEETSLNFLRYRLNPWLVRMEEAYSQDPDLMPDPELRVEHLVDQLLRADKPKRYASYLPARQAGWLTPNEIRAEEGFPPVDGGDDLQQTPVGGAVNGPAPAPAASGIVTDPESGSNDA